MATHEIRAEHLDALATAEHVITYLQTQMARLHAEATTLEELRQQEEMRLRQFLSQAYQVQGDFTLDTKTGTITTKEANDEPPAE